MAEKKSMTVFVGGWEVYLHEDNDQHLNVAMKHMPSIKPPHEIDTSVRISGVLDMRFTTPEIEEEASSG